jgi:hypothetical protein
LTVATFTASLPLRSAAPSCADGRPASMRPLFAPFVAVLLAWLALAGPARAAEPVAACAPGDRVASARIVAGLDREGLAKLGDNTIVRDGAPWPEPTHLTVVRGAAELDLGKVYELRHALLQIDADQGLNLELSADGTTWTSHPFPAHDTATGMMRRSAELPATDARYVRLSALDSSGVLALTELQLRCEKPAKGTLLFQIADAQRAPDPGAANGVTPARMGHVRLVLAAALLLGVVAWLRMRRAMTSEAERARVRRTGDVALAVLTVLAIAAYYNFGTYRYPHFIHRHDVFHYFVGSKYFPELSYSSLYDCSLVAQAEAGFPQRTSLWTLRDLRTNTFVPAEQALARADECHARLPGDRWTAFAADVRYFADADDVAGWNRVLRDHGFNATPGWITLGRLVAGHSVAEDATVGASTSMLDASLPRLDPLLLLAALGSLAWAFGWRAACVATLAIALDPLAQFAWVGGGFLRNAWLAALLVGVALAKKRRFVAAGVALGIATHLQIVPGLALVGVGLAALVARLRQRALPRGTWPTIAAATLTIAIGAAVVVPGAGRADAWHAFADNLAKHARTPSANLVGLPTVLSFRPSQRAALVADPSATDIFARARQARVEQLARLRPLHLVLAAAGWVALGWTLRRRRTVAWAAIVGLTGTLLLVDTSSYYLTWLAALAPLALRTSRALVAFAATLLALAVWPVVLPENESDVVHVASSLTLLVGVAAVHAALARARGLARG